ncbi:CRISPR-associated endonuclease Cas2 [bacterium]|nr:CRISPR-associated endonuclease Cas2 [bacterium]
MRTVYLVTYDISNDKRRDLVFRTLRGFGDHLQFSVFRCELSETENVHLRARLAEIIRPSEDQVLFADLGPAEGRGTSAIEALGQPYTHAERHAIVV